MGKRNVLVVYESDSPLLKSAAQRIGKVASAESAVVIRAAKDVTIPDILLADVYFFGSESQPAIEYAEIERVCRGINLAGRYCAFYSHSSVKSFDFLRSMVKDTDVNTNIDRILFSNNPDDNTLTSWVKAVIN
jgi:hypothetical protein